MTEGIGPLANDLQQLLPPGLIQGVGTTTVVVGRAVPSFLSKLLPHPANTGQAGTTHFGDVLGFPALLIKRDDPASLAYRKCLHADILR